MKVCYITSISKTAVVNRQDINKSMPVEVARFKGYEIKEELDSFGDIVQDGIKELGSKDILLTDINAIKEFTKGYKKCVNFSVKGSKVEFPTETAKDRLKYSPITIIAKGRNRVNTETGFIFIFTDLNRRKEVIGKISYQELAEYLQRNKGKVSNMFLKGNDTDGLELCSYPEIEIPSMVVGQKLEEVEETNEKPPVKPDKDEILPLKKMREKGFGNEINRFKLYNKAYEKVQNTLWFYLRLFEAGKKEVVGNMLTTHPYNTAQLEEIAKGIESGVGIRKYADIGFDADEMRMVRTALEMGQWECQVPLPGQAKKIMRDLATSKEKNPKKEKQFKEIKQAIAKNTITKNKK